MDHFEFADSHILDQRFFNQEPQEFAQGLLGKVLAVNQKGQWLMSRIIETEAYSIDEKASHSSLGYSEKRKALFMSPGTIYMYHSRGGDSLNFSCGGKGNAALIKSGYPLAIKDEIGGSIPAMQKNNPNRDGSLRSIERLCAGQALLCKALDLRISEWDGQQLRHGQFELRQDSYSPSKIIQTTRLGIRQDRDAHLPFRYIDCKYANFCTKNPLKVRNFQLGRDYTILQP